MTVVEDRVRIVLHNQADTMVVPDARPGESRARVIPMPTPKRRGRLAVAVAALGLVAVAGAVLAQRRPDAPAAATNPSTTSPPAQPSFRFETPTVVLEADSVQVIVDDRRSTPPPDVAVHGDPGMPNEYTTLELTWFDDEIEQRINFSFTSDGVDWWANEIRIYEPTPADPTWIEPPATGEFFRSPLGEPFVGDLDLPNLSMRGIRLQAFVPPDVCDAPTAPLVLVADYPLIDGFPGGFGATFQFVDTASCAAVVLDPYTFEFTTDDPGVARVLDEEPIDGYPATKSRVGLELVAPGKTMLLVVARDATGSVVDTVESVVIVRPSPSGLSTDGAIDTVPGSLAAP